MDQNPSRFKMDTRLQMSTAFHPQTDGQTEVVNKNLVQLIRGYNRKYPGTWDESLAYIQHSYNRAVYTSTMKSPFESCLGYLSTNLLDRAIEQQDEEETRDTKVTRANKFIERIRQIHLKVKEQLEKSQAKYKARHDKHRREHKLHVGDKVWLYLSKEKLQGQARKFKPLRYGPFTIFEQGGENAFRLDLPSFMRMYLVVNSKNLHLYEPSMLDEDEGL